MKNISFKNFWIISGILALIQSITAILFIIFDKNVEIFYPLSNLIFGIIMATVSVFAYKNNPINKVWFIISVFFSVILTSLFPVASLLPMVVLTALRSEKKISVLKTVIGWIIGILLVVISGYIAGACLLGLYMLIYDAPVPHEVGYFDIYSAAVTCFNTPAIVLFAVILGIRKHWLWFLLILLPVLLMLVPFLFTYVLRLLFP